jgi:hypothetical protein
MVTAITPTYDLTFVQGIPRDFVVSNWKNSQGEFIDLTGYKARLTMREFAAENAPLLIDLVSEGATDTSGIQLFPLQILCHFDADMTEAMTPLVGVRPVSGFPASSPTYKAGVYELRVTSPAGIPYPVVRGDVFITLGIVDDE